jgi:membrane associated rhomboid family serine protease
VKEGRRGTRQWRSSTPTGAPARRTPVVVPTLVGLNVAVYVLTAIVARNPISNYQSQLFYELVLWPSHTATGSWWQVVTSGFLHYGPLHIGMNMLALWVIGRDLELVLGRWRFTAVYLLSLLGGSASVMLFGAPEGPVAGASGAVFGLMGAVLVVAIRLKLNPSSVIGMIAINLVLSFAIPGISVLGHLGGLVTGALVAALMVYRPKDRGLAWQVGAVVAVLVVLVAVLAVRSAQLAALVGLA